MGIHIRDAHPLAEFTNTSNLIQMRILDTRPKNMERGIAEAVRIEEAEDDFGNIVTNRKSEWGRAPIREITVRNNLYD